MHRWNNLAFLPMTGVCIKMAKDENGRFHMGTLAYFLSAARVKYASTTWIASFPLHSSRLPHVQEHKHDKKH